MLVLMHRALTAACSSSVTLSCSYLAICEGCSFLSLTHFLVNEPSSGSFEKPLLKVSGMGEGGALALMRGCLTAFYQELVLRDLGCVLQQLIIR